MAGRRFVAGLMPNELKLLAKAFATIVDIADEKRFPVQRVCTEFVAQFVLNEVLLIFECLLTVVRIALELVPSLLMHVIVVAEVAAVQGFELTLRPKALQFVFG